MTTEPLAKLLQRYGEAAGLPTADGPGWVEGFKALTDLYSVADGAFAGTNQELEANPTLTDREPYGKGWLYLARGTPDPNSTDVQGYIQWLDATIDKMRS